MMEFHPDTERQIIELLKTLDLGGTHTQARIVGCPESICIYVDHKEPVEENGVMVTRTDANVYPTLKGLQEFEMKVKQGALHGNG